MTTTIAAKRRRWWGVIGYEVEMLRGLRGLRVLQGWVSDPSEDPRRTGWLLTMSINEGRVLHTRNLCDFCTPKYETDIRPCDLFDNYDTDPEYETLRGLIKRLGEQYDKKDDEGKSARWAFNKMLAHPTKERGKGFDYTPFLDRVLPVLEEIIRELELRGRPFSELPKIKT